MIHKKDKIVVKTGKLKEIIYMVKESRKLLDELDLVYTDESDFEIFKDTKEELNKSIAALDTLLLGDNLDDYERGYIKGLEDAMRRVKDEN